VVATVFSVGNDQYINLYRPVNGKGSPLWSRNAQGLPDCFELPQNWAVEPTSLSLPFLSVMEAIFSTSLDTERRRSSAIQRASFVSPGPLNSLYPEEGGWLRWGAAHGDTAMISGGE